MQFKHPEILYFLFLLVIPIIVHLFQLRRFKKEYFTNVRFLKELSIQTQKSSKIKKWLLLATRLLLLTFLIFAFAQPFFKAKDTTGSNNELIIILDNSFSMQAKGKNGELLKRAVQDILENTPEKQTFSLVTNTEMFWDTNVKSVQKELQNLKYSSNSFNLDFLMTKIESKKRNTPLDIVVVTDAIGSENKKINSLEQYKSSFVLIPEAENKNNVSIDDVAITGQLSNFYEITVTLSNFNEIDTELPIAVYDGNNMIAKTLIKFDSEKKSIKFTLPKKDFHGFVKIEDNCLSYDNTFYFSISKPKKSNVTVVGNPLKNNFLKRIYTADEFNLTESELNQLNYNSIETQDAIVLNELKTIPQSLGITLKEFYAKGGNIILIPSEENTTENLNSFLNNFTGIRLGALEKQEKQITKIAFNHPLYQGVFEKKTDNFQYPKVNSAFTLTGKGSPILTFSDQTDFLFSTTNKIGNLYVFASPLNKESSNLQNSPLIVPTFFNMGQNQQKTGITAYTIGDNETLILDAILSKEEVVTVADTKNDFIPMQQILNKKVKLSFGDYPEESGNYSVLKNKENLKNISFNYKRTESDLNLKNESLFDNFTSVNSVATVFNTIHSERTGNEIWKYFILATLVFLILELLIQKFVK